MQTLGRDTAKGNSVLISTEQNYESLTHNLTPCSKSLLVDLHSAHPELKCFGKWLTAKRGTWIVANHLYTEQPLV